MCAELTVNRDPPHTPRTYVEWSDFIIKLEQLLIQTVYTPHQKEMKNNISSSKTESSKIRGSNDNDKFRNNYRRKFTNSDIQFLKQKIKSQLSSDRVVTKENNCHLLNASHISSTSISTDRMISNSLQSSISSSSVIGHVIVDNTHNNSNKNNSDNFFWNDKSKVLSLSGCKEILSWWLPLLISLRKILKKNFVVYRTYIRIVRDRVP